MSKRYYVLLPNSNEAMKLYQQIKKAGIKSTVAPTPRNADHCCGVCILYDDYNDRDKICAVAKEINCVIDKFWETENDFDPNRNKFC